MVKFNKVKFMPLSSYTTAGDTNDVICAVDASALFNNANFPNWANAVALTSDTTYTVGSGALAAYKAGYLWFSGGRGGWRGVTINGTYFPSSWSYQDGHEGKLVFCPLSIGDTVNCSNGSERLFLPTVWSI